MKTIEAKTVVLGVQGVGKTSVVRRCVENIFEDDVGSTIGAAFSSYKVNIDDYKVHLQIWDTAGQERFKAMAPMFYRKASAAILVFDITDYKSFEGVQGWVTELIQNVDRPVAKILFGNKCDLEGRREVPAEVAREYALDIGAEYVEMSALSNEGVLEGFEKVAMNMIRELEDTHAQVYEDHTAVYPKSRGVSVRQSSSSSESEKKTCSC